MKDQLYYHLMIFIKLRFHTVLKYSITTQLNTNNQFLFQYFVSLVILYLLSLGSVLDQSFLHVQVNLEIEVLERIKYICLISIYGCSNNISIVKLVN